MQKFIMPVLAIVAVIFFAGVFKGYLDQPIVEISVGTGECARAYGPNGSIPCDIAMKDIYEKIWVK